jgi:GNAT superfamily N-acetyltransferase
MSEDEIRCEELRPELWPALEKLFGANGACAGCWCMWWRAERGGKFWKQLQGARAKRALRRLIASGGARGILAFSGERPVGWCAFGPRSDFPRLDRTKAFKRTDVDGVWSINCFFIARDFRAQGLARRLLDAAIRACARRGARIVEAYPITTTADGGKVAAASAYTGPLCIFEEQGFEVVQRLSATRPLVRRSLDS